MAYSFEEKKFMIDNHPRIEIESIDFEPTTSFGNLAFYPYYYANEDLNDKYLAGVAMNTIIITFHLRDTSPTLPIKLVDFPESIQLCAFGNGENFVANFDFSCPGELWPIYADKNGRFSFYVEFLLAPSNSDDEYDHVFERIMKADPFIEICGLKLLNNYVMTNIGQISGNINENMKLNDDINLGDFSFYPVIQKGHSYDIKLPDDEPEVPSKNSKSEKSADDEDPSVKFLKEITEKIENLGK